jgi:hypothetical protein
MGTNFGIITPVVALIGVVVGQVLARDGDYRKWLRSTRHDAATELLAVGEAVREHAATRIGARYALGQVIPGEPMEEQTLQGMSGEIVLGDIRRLTLAIEAVRTVFPRRVADMAETFGATVTALARLSMARPEEFPQSEGNPGQHQQYEQARRRFTEVVRSLVAPSLRDRLRLGRITW